MFKANMTPISTVSNKEEEGFTKTEDTITEIHEPKIEFSEENKTHMLHLDIL